MSLNEGFESLGRSRFGKSLLWVRSLRFKIWCLLYLDLSYLALLVSNVVSTGPWSSPVEAINKYAFNGEEPR